MKEMTTAEYEVYIAKHMTETVWQHQVLDWAQDFGWRRAHFRVARTVVRGQETWRTPVQGDGKGFPDLILLRPPRLVVVELKRQSAKGPVPGDDQDLWLQSWAAIPSAEVYIWRPLDRLVMLQVLDSASSGVHLLESISRTRVVARGPHGL